MISVIFPVYNDQEGVEQLHKRLVTVLRTLDEPYEIIAIDDGSTDGTRKRLISLSPITVVTLSRHFGYNAALDAGFQVAIGDFIITIDTDPNNHPEDIPLFIDKLREGYGVVVGWRKFHYSSVKRKILSFIANWFIRIFTGVGLHDASCPIKAYRREFVDGVQLIGETSIFMPVFAHDRGARLAEIEIVRPLQKEGISRYRLRDRFFMFFDLLSVKFLLNFFARPLRFFGTGAFFFLGLAGVLVIDLLVKKVLYHVTFSTPLLLIATMLGVLGVVIFILGFITEILLRIYYTNKDTFQYMIYEITKNK